MVMTRIALYRGEKKMPVKKQRKVNEVILCFMFQLTPFILFYFDEPREQRGHDEHRKAMYLLIFCNR